MNKKLVKTLLICTLSVSSIGGVQAFANMNESPYGMHENFDMRDMNSGFDRAQGGMDMMRDNFDRNQGQQKNQNQDNNGFQKEFGPQQDAPANMPENGQIDGGNMNQKPDDNTDSISSATPNFNGDGFGPGPEQGIMDKPEDIGNKQEKPQRNTFDNNMPARPDANAPENNVNQNEEKTDNKDETAKPEENEKDKSNTNETGRNNGPKGQDAFQGKGRAGQRAFSGKGKGGQNMFQRDNGVGQQAPPEIGNAEDNNASNSSESGQNGSPEGNGSAPQAPGGEMNGTMPEAPGAQNEGSRPEMPGMAEGNFPFEGAPAGAPSEYSAESSLESDVDGGSYAASDNNKSVILVDGKDVSVKNVEVSKTGDSESQDADFYGTNAAILAVNKGTLDIENAKISTDGTHANAVFSYGEGTVVNISDSDIETTGNNSGGLMTTGGASLNATNLNVKTSGNSSAAIRSDRGGGTVVVKEGTYEANGIGSPAIYSTADITVSDTTLKATNSEAVVIEGGNSVNLENVDITGCNATLNGQSTIKTNVLIYQSMSGDASEGNSEFTMTNGSMTCDTGAMFHVTNTTTTINLENIDFTYSDDSDGFLNISEDSWGQTGSNGGHVTLNTTNQEVKGNITVDDSSNLTWNMTASQYEGSINKDKSKANISVTIDDDSKWVLSGDSYITELNGNIDNVDTNGYHLYVNNKEIV